MGNLLAALAFRAVYVPLHASHPDSAWRVLFFIGGLPALVISDAGAVRAARLLGYQPSVALEDGLKELAGWLEGQVAVDRVEEAHAELQARGLTR